MIFMNPQGKQDKFSTFSVSSALRHSAWTLCPTAADDTQILEILAGTIVPLTTRFR
jgi:hypothetical protein